MIDKVLGRVEVIGLNVVDQETIQSVEGRFLEKLNEPAVAGI